MLLKLGSMFSVSSTVTATIWSSSVNATTSGCSFMELEISDKDQFSPCANFSHAKNRIWILKLQQFLCPSAVGSINLMSWVVYIIFAHWRVVAIRLIACSVGDCRLNDHLRWNALSLAFIVVVEVFQCVSNELNSTAVICKCKYCDDLVFMLGVWWNNEILF